MDKSDPILYYDIIAKEYNSKYESYASNNEVRKKVAEYLIRNSNGKNILDFGGGTGLDLHWLLENNFNVCFCEPSSNMRSIAIELNNRKIKSNKIVFLSKDQTDFTKWSLNTFPNKFDVVLANFAVINSVYDLNLLFQKMADVLNPGGHLIANMLDTSFRGIVKYHFKKILLAFIRNNNPSVISEYMDHKHIAHLHSPDKIRKSSSNYFSCKKIESLGGFGFMLVHLKRK